MSRVLDIASTHLVVACDDPAVAPHLDAALNALADAAESLTFDFVALHDATARLNNPALPRATALICVPPRQPAPGTTPSANYDTPSLANQLASIATAAAETRIARRVLVSSTAIYGKSRILPVRESDHATDHDPLAAHHAHLEALWLADDPQNTAILRAAPLYGPAIRDGLTSLTALALVARHFYGLRTLTTPLHGPQLHFAYAPDVARAAVFLALHRDGAGRIVNVADAAPTHLSTVMRLAFAAADVRPVAILPSSRLVTRALWLAINRSPGALVEPPLEDFNRWLQRDYARTVALLGLRSGYAPALDRDLLGLDGSSTVFDIQRLQSLGFAHAHPSFDDAFAATVAWQRTAGWLP